MVMPVHKIVYMREMGCGEEDNLLCEMPVSVNKVCEHVAKEIHHVIFESHGGKDEIDNLVALCKDCHDKAHGKRHGNARAMRTILLKHIQKRRELLNRIK